MFDDDFVPAAKKSRKYGVRTFTVTVDVDKAINDFFYSGASSSTGLMSHLRSWGVPPKDAERIAREYYGY
jgi:hypothetical protein